MRIIGREIELGVGVEETRGTAQGTAEAWVRKVTCDLIPRTNNVVDETTRGRLEDSQGRRTTRKWVEGDITGNVHADPIGYFLYNLFGAVSSSNVAGAVYSHEFTLQQSIQHASLSLFVKDGDIDQYVASGCMLTALSFEAAPDTYLTFTASFQGRTYASNADSPSYSAPQYDFIGRDITVKVAATEAGLAGASAQCVKNLTVTFTPNAAGNFCLGSYNPEDVYNKQFAIEGEIEKDYLDETFRDYYETNGGDDAGFYMQIAVVGEADIGGGNNPSLTFLFNNVEVMDWTRGDTSNEIVTENVSFKAFYNQTDSQQAKVTLQNLTSEYDAPISA